MRTRQTALGLLACCFFVACGGEPKEESSSGGSAGTGGAGGTTASGAGGTAGTLAAGGAAGSSGGNGGSSGGGHAGSEPSAGAHCSPGTPFSAGIGYAGGYLSNCSGYPFDDNAIMNGEDVSIRSLNLQEPLVPGQPYAISMDFVFNVGVLEFWGANEECGPGIEQLYAAPGANLEGTTFCLELDPSQQFSHLIMVWRMGAEHEDVAFCPGGTCG